MGGAAFDKLTRQMERLQALWRELNVRYFRGGLAPIEIAWSRRLTASAGLFVSRVGPRVRAGDCADTTDERRLIRLSSPLLQRPSEDPEQAEREILSTLAHEMIHQWQFDVLKRRPNHGPDFSRKMATMNRDGLSITVCHRFDEAVSAFAKHAWQCRRCGKIYERQRRTIRPSCHRCGVCQGSLKEVATARDKRPTPPDPNVIKPESLGISDVKTFGLSTIHVRPVQLELNFSIP